MPNIAEWAAAGLDAIHVSARNTAGHMNGFAKLALTDTNMGSGMRRLQGAITAPIAIPEPNRVPVRGDNRRITTFQFTADADNSFTLDMGIIDKTAEAFFQGSAVYALGLWDMGLNGAGGPTFQDSIFLLTRDAESQESGSVGASGFENLLLMNCNVMPISDDQWADSEAGGSRYSVTANPANVTPWGESVGTRFTLSDGLSIGWWSEYRTMLHSFVGDGTEDDVVVTYTPADNTTDRVKAFNATTNTALTVSTVTVATKTIGLSAAITTGNLAVIVYEAAAF